MSRLNKNYSTVDKYRHQLGILRTVMRYLKMTDNAPLSDIPTELYRQMDVLGEAAELATMYGTAFIQVMPDGTTKLHNPQDIYIHVLKKELTDGL